jgi:tripartite-type tricarboxylate transporter receptor subunit TctC
MRLLGGLFTVAIWLLTPPVGSASAQEWPTRSVTMVVGFAAGGGTDILGRIMAGSLPRRSVSK